MATYSSVISQKIDFIIQRGSGKGWVFRLPYANGTYVDWSQYPGVKMDIRSGNQIILSHEIGGALIIGSDKTNLEWHPWGIYNEEDLPPLDYEYDLKMPVPVIGAIYPIRGTIKVVDYITR